MSVRVIVCDWQVTAGLRKTSIDAVVACNVCSEYRTQPSERTEQDLHTSDTNWQEYVKHSARENYNNRGHRPNTKQYICML